MVRPCGVVSSLGKEGEKGSRHSHFLFLRKDPLVRVFVSVSVWATHFGAGYCARWLYSVVPDDTEVVAASCTLEKKMFFFFSFHFCCLVRVSLCSFYPVAQTGLELRFLNSTSQVLRLKVSTTTVQAKMGFLI